MARAIEVISDGIKMIVVELCSAALRRSTAALRAWNDVPNVERKEVAPRSRGSGAGLRRERAIPYRERARDDDQRDTADGRYPETPTDAQRADLGAVDRDRTHDPDCTHERDDAAAPRTPPQCQPRAEQLRDVGR